MVKAAYVDKNGLKRGAWSEEEDNKLRAYILRYGHWNWRLLPKFAGLERCGKSCRLRWMNYLKPGLKRGDYSQEERDLIAKLYHELGSKWSAIAAKLPGRTDNDIKNYCHTHLKDSEKSSTKSGQRAELIISREEQLEQGRLIRRASAAPRLRRRKQHENCNVSSSDIFIVDTSISSDSSLVSGVAVDSNSGSLTVGHICPAGATDDDGGSFSDLLVSGFHESFWTQPFMVDTYT